MSKLSHIPNPNERALIMRLVRDLLSSGHEITVYDGEEFPLKISTDEAVIFAAMGSTDEDWLYVTKGAIPEISERQLTQYPWIRLIYGNDIDLISDYVTSLEQWMAGVDALRTRLEENQVDFDPENIYGSPEVRQSIEEDRK